MPKRFVKQVAFVTRIGVVAETAEEADEHTRGVCMAIQHALLNDRTVIGVVVTTDGELPEEVGKQIAVAKANVVPGRT